jgi:t-SNARE complex subunit (syntaxin)
LALNTAGEPPSSLRRAVNGEMEMNTQAPKLEAAENDLKQLMADVTRAMEKAQEAVARIASKAAAATTETESTPR